MSINPVHSFLPTWRRKQKGHLKAFQRNGSVYIVISGGVGFIVSTIDIAAHLLTSLLVILAVITVIIQKIKGRRPTRTVETQTSISRESTCRDITNSIGDYMRGIARHNHRKRRTRNNHKTNQITKDQRSISGPLDPGGT